VTLRGIPVKRFRIGEVCGALGRSERTVRYWEQAGRIPLAHRDLLTGRRWWTETEVTDLQLMVYGDDLDVLAAA